MHEYGAVSLIPTLIVLASIAPYMSAWSLPILTFITMAFISFTTGSNWGVFAIAIPVVFPLAQEVGVSAHCCLECPA